MKPSKKFVTASSFLAFFMSLSVVLLLPSCKCKQIPPGGGSVGIALSGTVLEEFIVGSVVTNAGDSVSYVSNGITHVCRTVSSGAFGPDSTIWDGNSIITYASCKSGAIDEIVYNRLGSPPYNDLQNDSFIFTTPGSTIPVVVTAQAPGHGAHQGSGIQIKDAALHVVASGTTDVNGVFTFNAGLAPNSVYWLYANTASLTPVHFQFNTAPIEGTTGALCKLRFYVRY
ncbi:MAG: hypothetical protein JWO06_2243 [Bacteroidota bacterium]|nr:hypothetical protein [Bacteroidota bacterium]